MFVIFFRVFDTGFIIFVVFVYFIKGLCFYLLTHLVNRK